RPSWLGMFAGSLVIALFVSAGWLVERSERRRFDSKPIAVVKKSETLRRGDGAAFLPRRDIPLPPGVEVRVLDTRHGWSRVELADGSVGWMTSSSLEFPKESANANSLFIP